MTFSVSGEKVDYYEMILGQVAPHLDNKLDTEPTLLLSYTKITWSYTDPNIKHNYKNIKRKHRRKSVIIFR